MAQYTLREIIAGKLAAGQLPYRSIPRVWGSEGHGKPCNGCGLPIEPQQRMNEGDASTGEGSAVRFHTACFYIWDSLRSVAAPPPTT